MSMASFCQPEACGVTPSATLAPSQRWLLCPAGHTHCLALSSYTTPKQTADHPQRIKKDEEVVQRWPLKSHFLILVTSSVSIKSFQKSFPLESMCVFILPPVEHTHTQLCYRMHTSADVYGPCISLSSHSLYRTNGCGQREREFIRRICLHNQPQVSAISALYLSTGWRTRLAIRSFAHPTSTCCRSACVCNQPWLNKQISSHQRASGHLQWPATVSKQNVCLRFRYVAQLEHVEHPMWIYYCHYINITFSHQFSVDSG